MEYTAIYKHRETQEKKAREVGKCFDIIEAARLAYCYCPAGYYVYAVKMNDGEAI